MTFEYKELKECVEEDFERFYKLSFNEKQIYSAVLDEYQHGEDFDLVENICIHVFLILFYAKKNLNYSQIIDRLNQLMNKKDKSELRLELGHEHSQFITDLSIATNNKK